MTLLVYRELTPENKSISNPTFTRFAYMEVLLVHTKNDLGGGGFAIILIVSKQQIYRSCLLSQIQATTSGAEEPDC